VVAARRAARVVGARVTSSRFVTAKLWAVARRRALVVLLSVLLAATAAAFTASSQRATYSSRAVLLVPPSQQSGGAGAAARGSFLGDPADADRLASTYAVLLNEDVALFEAAGDAAGVTVEELGAAVSASQIEDTSLIEVIVRTNSEGLTGRILDEFVATATTSTEPRSRAIATGSLRAVRLEEPQADSPQSVLLAVTAGALLGAVLGVAVAVLRERSDPRIDTAADLVGLVDAPVQVLSSSSVESVLEGWRRRVGAGGAVVAVQCDENEEKPLGEALTNLVHDAGVRVEPAVGATSENPPGLEALLVDMSGVTQHAEPPLRLYPTAPAVFTNGRRAAVEGGLIVCVVAAGTLESAAVEGLRALARVDIAPDLVLIHS